MAKLMVTLRIIVFVVAVALPCAQISPAYAQQGGPSRLASTWSTTGSMTIARYGHTATSLADGRVLVMNGYNDGWPVPSCEIYDPALGTWSLTGSMVGFVDTFTATLLPDARVLVSGGNYTSSAQLYDPALGTWTFTGSMSTARAGHTATLLAGGQVLVAGGVRYGGDPYVNVLASVEIYDPAQGTWSLTGALSERRMGHKATLLLDGRVLVTGGYDGGNFPLATTEIYDPARGTWSLAGSMSTPRGDGTATRLPDGRVLVASGSGTSSTELYDPALGTWSVTAPMSTARGAHLATRLPGGQVLVTGGYGLHELSLATAEIYDPAHGTWSATGSMSVSRWAHTATLLANGGVLVTGGFDTAQDFPGWRTAEIYDTGTTAPPDASPPQIWCGAADGAWHDSDVTINCTASDPESGLANAADASFTLTTNVPIGTETVNGATNSREVCNTVAGCTTAGPFAGNRVDKKAPTITIASPAAGATYQVNARVSASYGCADGGAGVASCQGPVAHGSLIETSSAGTKTFLVAATDIVGNSSTATVTYTVAADGGEASADVGIALLAPVKVSPGGTMTYAMTLKNAGAANATGVVVSNALPAGTVFVSASTSQGTVTAPAVGSNGTVSAAVGSLAPGATASVSVVVTVKVAAGTTLTDTATVTATTPDSNSRNNSATQKTMVKK